MQVDSRVLYKAQDIAYIAPFVSANFIPLKCDP